MTIVRDTIYQALFDHVTNLVPSLVTKSRIVKHWADVPASERPALFMADAGGTPIQKTGWPTVWKLDVKFYLYVSTDGVTPPGSVFNPILDAISNSLSTDPNNTLTLGGLVQWARLEGTVITDDGTLGNDAVCVFNAQMLTA
jgi:hypothetical protein